MKKIITLIFLCLFCIGCEAKYELVINEDLTVEESITGLEDNEFYGQYYKSTKERVVGFLTETVDDYLNEIGYLKTFVDYGDLAGALVNKKFSSIDEYFEKSESYTQFYDDWDYTIKNGVVTISLKDQLLRNEDSIDRYVIDTCDVSITLPFKVKKSNANHIDKKTNTYTWNLDDETAQDIYIKFDTTKKANYDNSNYLSYAIIIIVLIAITALIYYIYDKNKLSNEI